MQTVKHFTANILNHILVNFADVTVGLPAQGGYFLRRPLSDSPKIQNFLMALIQLGYEIIYGPAIGQLLDFMGTIIDIVEKITAE